MQLKTKSIKNIILFLSILFSSEVYGQVVTSGLVAKYCFDGNAQDAVGTRHCTVNGATLTTDRKGNLNSAYSFDGVDDYIQMPNDVWVSGNFSITGWILLRTYGHWSRFFEWGNGVDKDNVFFSPCESSTATSVFTIHKCSSSLRTYGSSPTASFPTNVWVHIAITLSGDTARIYKDNVFWYDYKMTHVPCSTIRTMCYFGKSNFAADKSLDGKLDDIRVYNRSLSPKEIDSIYNSTALCQQLSISESEIENVNNHLSQNVPNPILVSSTIMFQIPFHLQSGFIDFVDLTGKVVKHVKVDANANSINIERSDFAPGIYYYYLTVNGIKSNRKKMIVLGE